MKNLFAVLRKLSTVANPNPPPLWVREFGPTFAVPEEITAKLKDISWHNDTSPCFCISGDEQTRLRLWVDHVDRDQRESGGPRYTVTEQDERGDYVRTIIETENADSALIAIVHRAGEIFNQ